MKCGGLEKAKYRLQCEMEDLALDVARASACSAAMEKKQRQCERLAGEWRGKCEAAAAELEGAQREARQFAAEVLRVRAQAQEAQEAAEAVRRENKALSDEVRSLVEGEWDLAAFLFIYLFIYKLTTVPNGNETRVSAGPLKAPAIVVCV